MKLRTLARYHFCDVYESETFGYPLRLRKRMEGSRDKKCDYANGSPEEQAINNGSEKLITSP